MNVVVRVPSSNRLIRRFQPSRLVSICLAIFCALGLQDTTASTAFAFRPTSLAVQRNIDQDSAHQQTQDARPLVRGDAVERDMAGGQMHLYQLFLISGQYVRVVVDQIGIDVMVMLSTADGKKVVEVDSPN